jgi:hypothetical protein
MSDIIEKLIQIIDPKFVPRLHGTVNGKYLARIVKFNSTERNHNSLDVIIILNNSQVPILTNVKLRTQRNIESECIMNNHNIVYLNIFGADCEADVYPVCLGDKPATDGYKKVKNSNLVFRSKLAVLD